MELSTPSEKTSGGVVKIFGKAYSVSSLRSLSLFVNPPPYLTLLMPANLDQQLMGAAILRLSKLKAKWSNKISTSLEAKKTKGIGAFSRKYAMALLPFITVLREGLEAVIFVGGVSLDEPASAFPIPVITGLLAGALVGWLIYKGGNTVKIQIFLVISTMVLYLVAAALFSRAVWNFEMWRVISPPVAL